MLTKKYGFFRITENMIKISKRELPVIWIHSHEEISVREYPLSIGNRGQAIKIMLLDIFGIFIKIKPNSIFDSIK